MAVSVWYAAPVRLFVLLAAVGALCAEYRPPAGFRSALRGLNGSSILPGGRVIQPLGEQFVTGPGPFGLAISPSGRNIATANLGPERSSLTILESDKRGVWSIHNLFTARAADRENDFHSLFFGIAFNGEKQVWVAEGDSGRVRLIDLASGSRRKTIDLNAGDLKNSFSGALALDSARNLLYVLDQAHFRVLVYDTKASAPVTSVYVGFLPYALALSPDGQHLYVTNVGLFRYHALPGADQKRAGETGLAFPAFGFPSIEATAGVQRRNSTATVAVPPLGDPNVRESNSVCILDVATPNAAKVIAFVRTGLPFGPDNAGGSSPSGVLATADAVYVSNAHNDTVDVP